MLAIICFILVDNLFNPYWKLLWSLYGFMENSHIEVFFSNCFLMLDQLVKLDFEILHDLRTCSKS